MKRITPRLKKLLFYYCMVQATSFGLEFFLEANAKKKTHYGENRLKRCELTGKWDYVLPAAYYGCAVAQWVNE